MTRIKTMMMIMTTTTKQQQYQYPWQRLRYCHDDKLIARVHTVYPVNAEQWLVSANHHIKPTDWGHESASRRHHLYQPSTFSIAQPTIRCKAEGRVDLAIAVRECSPFPKLYIAVVFCNKHISANSGIKSWNFTHHSRALHYSKVSQNIQTKLMKSYTINSHQYCHHNIAYSCCECNH